jgi:hypothetical protein
MPIQYKPSVKHMRILIIVVIVIVTTAGVYLSLPHLQPMVPVNYAYLEIVGVNDVYNANHAIKFQIKATGYGITCGLPSITVYKSDQPSIIVYEKKFPPFMCPISSPTFFSNMYPEKNDTYSLTIKDPSRYTIDTSFLNHEIKKEFEVK